MLLFKFVADADFPAKRLNRRERREQRSGGAIADFSKAIELDPKDAGAWFDRSLARKAKGDQAGADADLAQAGKVQGR